MREKIYMFLTKVYGILMSVSFFAGILPVVPFLAAILVGGTIGEAIAVFLYKTYYTWVIAGAAIAVLLGFVATYLQEGNKQ